MIHPGNTEFSKTKIGAHSVTPLASDRHRFNGSIETTTYHIRRLVLILKA
jgi:hypothetical protein